MSPPEQPAYENAFVEYDTGAAGRVTWPGGFEALACLPRRTLHEETGSGDLREGEWSQPVSFVQLLSGSLVSLPPESTLWERFSWQYLEIG